METESAKKKLLHTSSLAFEHVLEQSLLEHVLEQILLEHELEPRLLEHVLEQTPLEHVLEQSLLEFDHVPEQSPTTPNLLAFKLNVATGIYVCIFMCIYT